MRFADGAKVKPPKHYYGVCWGKIVKVQQAANPREACKLAFGRTSDDMRVKLIADQKAAVNPKKLPELLANPETWNLLAKGVESSEEARHATPPSGWWVR